MARISELHYSDAYASSSGVSEFLEVALQPGEDPADFTVSFYQVDGSVGIEIALDDPLVQTSIDPDNGELVYVISADDFPILLTGPDSSNPNNYEAYALTNTDTSTVIDFYDIGGGTQNITALDGVAAGATSENLLTLGGSKSATYSLQFNQPNPDTLSHVAVTPGDTGLACFTTGTLIDTPSGPRKIETLEPGDEVITLDGGSMPLRWIGKRTVQGCGDLAPIRIAKGQYGATTPVLVSPQHRILVTGWRAELLFGEPEVLVPAKALVNDQTVRSESCGQVTYIHLLFDSHQIVTTSGLHSESYFPVCAGEAGWCAETAAELDALFPAQQVPQVEQTARPALSVRLGALLRND